eukprot:CAMPEP_0175061232 /NCGR_PEP_ID=MMETSP0052_2-20121109/13470_1 /TAXON_ID=51329 ORGANISM="Polytomella parva, Strain SAG 63-3" /NCGR_SAMPLE_ID=MMETSP0052_2 /ASSEMBLY_ACC=CAM_ASM_000194 /LENGTH=726 /DNA_ID=CAMNT_0016327063 /DNA_START=841 /DNA_END=3018 /DNA_ORIENTATION=-
MYLALLRHISAPGLSTRDRVVVLGLARQQGIPYSITGLSYAIQELARVVAISPSDPELILPIAGTLAEISSQIGSPVLICEAIGATLKIFASLVPGPSATSSNGGAPMNSNNMSNGEVGEDNQALNNAVASGKAGGNKNNGSNYNSNIGGVGNSYIGNNNDTAEGVLNKQLGCLWCCLYAAEGLNDIGGATSSRSSSISGAANASNGKENTNTKRVNNVSALATLNLAPLTTASPTAPMLNSNNNNSSTATSPQGAQPVILPFPSSLLQQLSYIVESNCWGRVARTLCLRLLESLLPFFSGGPSMVLRPSTSTDGDANNNNSSNNSNTFAGANNSLNPLGSHPFEHSPSSNTMLGHHSHSINDMANDGDNGVSYGNGGISNSSYLYNGNSHLSSSTAATAAIPEVVEPIDPNSPNACLNDTSTWEVVRLLTAALSAPVSLDESGVPKRRESFPISDLLHVERIVCVLFARRRAVDLLAFLRFSRSTLNLATALSRAAAPSLHEVQLSIAADVDAGIGPSASGLVSCTRHWACLLLILHNRLLRQLAKVAGCPSVLSVCLPVTNVEALLAPAAFAAMVAPEDPAAAAAQAAAEAAVAATTVLESGKFFRACEAALRNVAALSPRCLNGKDLTTALRKEGLLSHFLESPESVMLFSAPITQGDTANEMAVSSAVAAAASAAAKAATFGVMQNSLMTNHMSSINSNSSNNIVNGMIDPQALSYGVVGGG